MSSPIRIGATMYVLAAALVLALLTLLFSDAIDRRRNPNRSPISVSASDGAKSIVLRRNRAGHYVVNGRVNGHTAEFLLDIGLQIFRKTGRPAQRAPGASGYREWYYHRLCDFYR